MDPADRWLPYSAFQRVVEVAGERQSRLKEKELATAPSRLTMVAVAKLAVAPSARHVSRLMDRGVEHSFSGLQGPLTSSTLEQAALQEVEEALARLQRSG